MAVPHTPPQIVLSVLLENKEAYTSSFARAGQRQGQQAPQGGLDEYPRASLLANTPLFAQIQYFRDNSSQAVHLKNNKNLLEV